MNLRLRKEDTPVTVIETDILCGCGREIVVKIALEENSSDRSDELEFYCNSYSKEETCNDFEEGIDFLRPKVHEFLRDKRIRQLLREKEDLLFKYGFFFWKKQVNVLHKQINEQLEALGVYQGKFKKS